MASINKLSIQGIRSFGSDDYDRQVIQFFNPLTLILGCNGTGKTSIIESLKYATTGDMPPNSKGGGFVHDPKLAGVCEIKAQVKLQFVDVRGKTTTVVRSLLAMQKAKKLEVKTLDSTIFRRGEDGQQTSVSNKCADINREMIACLGVSKPIMNNVIFCHQEDSNWPLAEGKFLKQKFDEIFAATRYIKALEDIRAFRKELGEDIRVCKETLKHYLSNKEQAAQFNKELEENETRLLASTDSIRKVEEKLVPLEEKLQKLARKENEITSIAKQIAQKETQLVEAKRTVTHLRENIKEPFQGSTDELRRQILNFDMEVQEKTSTIKNLEMDIKQKQIKVGAKGKEKSKKLLVVGKLKTEAEQHSEKKKQRDKHIAKLSSQYNISGYNEASQEFNLMQVDQFLKAMNSSLQSLLDEHKATKNSYEAKEKAVQSKLDELRDSKTKLDQSIRLKTDSTTKNAKELRQVENELRQIDASAAQQSQLEAELERAEKELTDVEGSVDVGTVRNEIEKMKQERSKHEAELKKLDSEMQKMHLQSSTQAELDLLRNDQIAKTDMIRKLIREHEETLAHVLGRVPSENIRDEIEDALKKLDDSTEKLNRQRQNLQIKISSASSERKMLQAELTKKEEELKRYEEKIFQACGSQNFDAGIETLQRSIKNMQDAKGTLFGSEFFWKAYVEKLEKEDPCCPLCHRGFESDQENLVTKLIRELKNKLHKIPSQVESKEAQLNEQQAKYNTLMQLQPLKDQIGTLSEKEIPELKEKIKSLEENIEQNKKQLSECEGNLDILQVDADMAKSALNDMIVVDQTQAELKKIDKKISSVSSKLIGGDSSRSIHQVNKEKEALQHKYDRLKQDLERKQETLSDHMELVQQLRAKVNDLRTDQLQISKELQRYKTLEDKKADLGSSIRESERIINQDKEQLTPLQQKLQERRDEKESIVAAKEGELDELQQKVDELRSKHKEIVMMQRDVQSYSSEGKERLLTETEDELQKLDEELQQLEREKAGFGRQLDEVRNEISSQEVRKRELKDNLDLRKKEKEIENLLVQKKELEEEYGDLNVEKIQREKKKFIQEVHTLTSEKHQVLGRKNELETNIRKLKGTLNQETYKKAAEQHKDKLIEVKTTEMAMSDLKKYYEALDKAIMQYHLAKMEEINKIVRELWQETYQGNDIEYIKIQTDEDETSSGGDKRRVYHYRVVMFKGDEVPMDMRGRCSAGQKVLASLIIRLALAEVFCISCGVFTLDEPTTNLDRENIEALSRSLVGIVKARKAQQNFQLVIISHDEEFIKMLSREQFIEHFYRISRSSDGNTRIRKHQLSTLEFGQNE